jgi:predicted phage terminase large subunit-like protein
LFLGLVGIEAFFGGAAGPGKSSAILMAALQFVDVPNYAAIILRKSFADLNQPGALIPRSIAWLGGTDASWSATEHAWHFPSGAVLKFGYLDGPMDIYQYQSAEFTFIGYDELSQFREFDYRYMFSRLRRPAGMNVPLRCRAASNPGGIGHQWVRRRFIDGRKEGRIFVPARLDDNPHIDREAYIRSMDNLDPITRRQLLNGDWTARQSGSMLRREWFEIVEAAPETTQRVRYWDMAASEPTKKGRDPDWTAGALLAFSKGIWYLENVQRFRALPKAVEDRIRQIAQIDGQAIAIRMEQEPGASGKSVIDYYARNVLDGFNFAGMVATSDKISRAGPFSSAAEGGRFKLVRGPWISEFFDEIDSFPDGAHDDQVDCISAGMQHLSMSRQILVA